MIDSRQVDSVAEVRERTNGRGADAAIVACGSKTAQTDALMMVRKRGRVALYGGLPKNDPINAFDANRIHYDEVSLIGTFSYHPDQHQQALEMIASGEIAADKLITATFSIAQVETAFNAVMDHRQLKVMLIPDSLMTDGISTQTHSSSREQL
jgi:L-iditol 2-dehydrogenase